MPTVQPYEPLIIKDAQATVQVSAEELKRREYERRIKALQKKNKKLRERIQYLELTRSSYTPTLTTPEPFKFDYGTLLSKPKEEKQPWEKLLETPKYEPSPLWKAFQDIERKNEEERKKREEEIKRLTETSSLLLNSLPLFNTEKKPKKSILDEEPYKTPKFKFPDYTSSLLDKPKEEEPAWKKTLFQPPDFSDILSKPKKSTFEMPDTTLSLLKKYEKEPWWKTQTLTPTISKSKSFSGHDCEKLSMYDDDLYHGRGILPFILSRNPRKLGGFLGAIYRDIKGYKY
jgi:hypothetical protein